MVHNESKPTVQLKSLKYFDADRIDLPPMNPSKSAVPATPSKPVVLLETTSFGGLNTPSDARPKPREETMTSDDAPRLPGIEEIKSDTPPNDQVKSSVAFEFRGTAKPETELATQSPTAAASSRRESSNEDDSTTPSRPSHDAVGHFHISTLTTSLNEMKIRPPSANYKSRSAGCEPSKLAISQGILYDAFSLASLSRS
ncbi:unnamed protein product [Dibothriocephalus latus]|uniref:Uncharacterized protein n=1 Tax=Dibothriocephalus latus TaxID=60516 RepID=A0A3P7P4A1_DIBLA|nr:unnamed protein product [Dibothriocephalus latus]